MKLTHDQLKDLEVKIGYQFKDINHLAGQLEHFGVLFLSPERQVVMGGLLQELRARKDEFIKILYQTIVEQYKNESDKRRGEIYKSLADLDRFLDYLGRLFELHRLEILNPSDSIYSMLFGLLSLFVCNAVFTDIKVELKAEEQQEARLLWLGGIIRDVLPMMSLQYDPFGLDRYRQGVGITHEEQQYSRSLNFEFEVLSFDLSRIEKPQELPPLLDCVDLRTEGEGRERYFRQFLPYILEEARAGIEGQYRFIHKRSLKGFPLFVRSFPDIDEEDRVVICHFKMPSQALPRLDHTFAVEAVLLTQGKTELLAIAMSPRYVKDGAEVVLKVAVLADSIVQAEELFRKGVEWKAHHLVGLIGFSRMFEVCSLMPDNAMLMQSMTAKLPAWPLQDQIAMLQGELVAAHLNTSQFAAVSTFYQAETGLFCLQGPPGTGKTTTIIQLLRLLVQTPKKRVLVCAPSNKAIRLLVTRAKEAMPNVRMALTGIAKDLPVDLQEVFINDRANMMCAPLKKHLRYFTTFHQIAKEQVEKSRKIVADRLLAFDEEKEQLIARLYESVGFFDWLLQEEEYTYDFSAKGVVEKLSEKLNGKQVELIQMLENYQRVLNEISKLAEAGRLDLWPTLSAAHSMAKGDVLEAQALLEQFDTLFTKASDLLQCYIEEIEQAAEPVEILLLQSSQIIFATLVSSGRKWLKKYMPYIDELIIDEETQAVEPEVLIPFVYRPKKCLLVGDTRQLSATVLSRAAQNRDYDRSMMCRLMEVCKQPHQMLSIQYRMHPAICEWPSNRNYHKRLITDKSLFVRPSPLVGTKVRPEFLTPCLFIDVKGEENRRGELTQSIKNEKEAEALVTTLVYLLKFFDSDQMGVITFYSAQVALLREKISKCSPKARAVMVSTVDGFQGEEKDCILISTVRSSPSVGFLRNERRINVAVTRPRHHLILFGNRASLARSNSALANLISHYEKVSDGECLIKSYEKK